MICFLEGADRWLGGRVGTKEACGGGDGVDRPTMARVVLTLVLGAAPTPPPHPHRGRGPWPCLSSSCSLPCVVTFVCMQLSASLSELIDLQFGDPYTSYYTHACTPTDDDDVHPSFHVPVVAWNVPAMPHASRPSLLHLQIRENGNACTVDEPRSNVPVTDSQGHGLQYTPTVYPHLM